MIKDNDLPDIPMTEHDKKLLAEAQRVSGIQFDYVMSLADQAETYPGYEAIKRIAMAHYHDEEFRAGIL